MHSEVSYARYRGESEWAREFVTYACNQERSRELERFDSRSLLELPVSCGEGLAGSEGFLPESERREECLARHASGRLVNSFAT